MSLRVLLHEREHAWALAARLETDGFAAAVGQERFAGEDDDEDHAWCVQTDAPSILVEVLAEEYDGWVLCDDPPAGPVEPLDLPSAPRRLKNPGGGAGADPGQDTGAGTCDDTGEQPTA